jgi:two-component system nitrogen regulation sensor histidine kinase GlnL
VHTQEWFVFCRTNEISSKPLNKRNGLLMIASAVLNQQLLEYLNTGILLLDVDLCVIYMNPAAEVLLQVSGRRGLGEHFCDLAWESEEEKRSLQNSINTGYTFTNRETEVVLHNTHSITVDYSVSPIVHPESRTPCLLIEIQGRDRLMRISREEQILSKQETTRELVRGMAHEIKNPLGGIRGAAQLLSRALPDESLDEYTNIIIEEADRLRDLVDSLLGSHQLPKQETTNIHEVIERVCQLIEVDQAGDINIVRDYDPSIPEFINDKSQLIQAILNLCRNAVQAMVEADVEKPTLSLRTRTKNQFTIGHQRHRLVAHISIVDNGPGIPENLKENLFYPMVSGRAEGTGLGLSIAQSLINQHEGIIEYESETGHTDFSIFLPLKHS